MVANTFDISECGHKSLSVNQFINSHMELKKLRMHTPDNTGKTKCHKLHIGSENLVCPDLHVHGTPMKLVSEDTYLGDIVRSDGRNTSSLKNRISRGVGCIADITNILQRVSFGKFYFQIALALREAKFLNSVLTNVEVWYGLRNHEIEELEKLDRSLLCQILALPQSTPSEALFLETGCLNIGTIVKIRRINYLHHLLKSDEKSMLSKFFKTQLKFPVRDDWTEQVKQDLQDFNIKEDFQWIKSMSKASFSKLVKRCGKEYALTELNKKKSAHSKLCNIEYDDLKLQAYLKCDNISVRQAHTLIKFRTRMAKYGGNYKGANASPECPLCGEHGDNQEEIYICKFNKSNVKITGNYKEIFKCDVSVETINSLETLYRMRLDKLS